MNAIIKITGRCNLRCKYCSLGDKKYNSDLSLERYKKFINLLYKELIKRNESKCNIILHGGEPLVRGIEFLESIIVYTLEYMNGIDVRFSIQTNGLLIDKDFIRLFEKYDINVGISLDGPKEFNDLYRVDINGNGTFDRIINNIELMKSYGIDVAILMVYNDNLKGKEKDVLQFIYKYDFNCKINPMIRCGDASDLDLENSYAKFLINIFKEYICLDKHLEVEPLSSMMRSIINNVPMSECTFSTSCIKNFVCIDYDGDIYPCGRFSDINKFCYGNVDELDNLIDEEIFGVLVKRRLENIPIDCVNCEYRSLCNAGCSMTSLVNSDDIYSKTCFCDEYKELFEFMNHEALILIKEVLLKRRKALIDAREE